MIIKKLRITAEVLLRLGSGKFEAVENALPADASLVGAYVTQERGRLEVVLQVTSDWWTTGEGEELTPPTIRRLEEVESASPRDTDCPTCGAAPLKLHAPGCMETEGAIARAYARAATEAGHFADSYVGPHSEVAREVGLTIERAIRTLVPADLEE